MPLGGAGFPSIKQVIEKVERLYPYRTRPLVKRRRRIPEAKPGSGPTLVRGRGLRRRYRNPDHRWRRIWMYLLLGCAASILIHAIFLP